MSDKPAAEAGSDTNQQAFEKEQAMPGQEAPGQVVPEQGQESKDKIDALEKALSESESKVKEHWDAMLRSQAEAENIRRRTEREVKQSRQFALEKFASELLDVVDTLERALETKGEGEAFTSMAQGVELTLKMLTDRLEKFNVKALNPIGEAFNPEHHEAMSMVEDPNAKPNSVVAVMQKGYLLHERLLRPARVVVAKAQPEKKIDETA